MPDPTRRLLWAAIAVPILYFGTMLAAALFYPGYSHVTQYASELGSSSARYPSIFNTGVVLTGLAAVASGFAVRAAVAALGGLRMLALASAICLALFGVSLVLGGLFPMPDPRHGGFGLGLAVHVAPFALAASLWRQAELRSLTRYLVANGIIMLVLFAIMMGVGALVTRSNVGLFQRAYALTIFPWIGVAGVALRRRLHA